MRKVVKSCELIFFFFGGVFFGLGGGPPIEGYAGIHKIECDVVYLCTVYCAEMTRTCPFRQIDPTTGRTDSGNANAGI